MKKLLLQQLAMITRFTLYVFLIQAVTMSLLLAAEGKAQDVRSVKDVRLTVNFSSEDVTKAFERIESLTEFTFAYNASDLRKTARVSGNFSNKSLYEILIDISRQTGIKFKQVDKNINAAEKGNPPQEGAVEIAVQITVTGTVTSASDGEGLPGVNVLVKGTSMGTVTDLEGKYSLSVPEESTLVFSFIGFETQSIAVGDRSMIDVTLSEDMTSLDEVVVVGYGTQKKVNLTGSVSSLDMEQLEKKTVTNVSQLLAGEVSGLTVTQGTGSPGDDQASITVRGLGTFSGAGNSPLVLVDGIPSSLNSVNPNDVANISVLKDASSAAIYGSRGANGVILVTTKTGKEGRTQVRYDTYFGKQEVPELPQYVDSWVFAEATNEAYRNVGKGGGYTQEDIDRFRSGEDSDNYPNKHHVRDLYNSGSGFQTKQNLTFSGGTEAIQYLVSAGYLKQKGVIDRNYYDRYDLRLNINSNLSENLKLNALFKSTFGKRNEPAIVDIFGTQSFGGLISKAFSSNATVPGKRSDGTFGTWMGHPGPWVALESESFYEDKATDFVNNISLEWDVINSLKLTGRIGYNWNYSKDKLFGAVTTSSPREVFGPSTAEVNMNHTRHLTMDIFADYDKTFGGHYLHILGGHSLETYDAESLGAFRDNFPTNTIHVLNAASSANDENWESAYAWKIRSYFGRLNYSFQQKYLLEGNLRYDGSSRFAEDNRYGFFPSVSAGWIISEESFFEIPWIDVLKIRGSYGKLGNQQIGTYPYQRTLSLDHRYFVGGVVQQAVVLDRLPFEDISWETTQIINGGLDINLFDGKLNFVVDHYYKKTSDILYSLTVSQILGMGVGQQNAGEVENRGWDFDLTYRDTKGDFSYSIRTVFSSVDNKVTSLANVDRDIGQSLFIGEPLNSYYGYETEGLFIDEEDIQNYAEQNYPAKPGYIRYKDISGPEGVPDGKITADHDRTVLGSTFPKYSYGMILTANYKNFDLYVQFQGTGGNVKLTDGKRLPLYNQGNIEQWHWDERWTEENPDRWAKFPRFEETYEHQPYDNVVLEYWLVDASFLRVKNIQLGYNLPSKLLNSTFIDELRINISGENIHSFDYYREGWDPEMSTLGGYNLHLKPITRLWSLGINVNF